MLLTAKEEGGKRQSPEVAATTVPRNCTCMDIFGDEEVCFSFCIMPFGLRHPQQQKMATAVLASTEENAQIQAFKNRNAAKKQKKR